MTPLLYHIFAKKASVSNKSSCSGRGSRLSTRSLLRKAMPCEVYTGTRNPWPTIVRHNHKGRPLAGATSVLPTVRGCGVQTSSVIAHTVFSVLQQASGRDASFPAFGEAKKGVLFRGRLASSATRFPRAPEPLKKAAPPGAAFC